MDTGAIVFIIFLVGAGVGILRCLHKKEKRKNQEMDEENPEAPSVKTEPVYGRQGY